MAQIPEVLAHELGHVYMAQINGILVESDSGIGKAISEGMADVAAAIFEEQCGCSAGDPWQRGDQYSSSSGRSDIRNLKGNRRFSEIRNNENEDAENDYENSEVFSNAIYRAIQAGVDKADAAKLVFGTVRRITRSNGHFVVENFKVALQRTANAISQDVGDKVFDVVVEMAHGNAVWNCEGCYFPTLDRIMKQKLLDAMYAFGLEDKDIDNDWIARKLEELRERYEGRPNEYLRGYGRRGG